MGKFHLIASLGQGGMAKVYLALMAGPAGFNKLMVVKVLRDDVLAGSEEGIRMFWDEARLAAQMVHPNIVHTYEVGEIDGKYYMAMEYLDGQTYRVVQTRSEANEGIPLHEHLRILAETARGLHYAHELKAFNGERLGVVHRDVSPQNVFITYDGQVKLLDFGIAKAKSAEHLTQVGVIKGKLDYIAPEQLRGDELDGRADVFALGAMLWEAITGDRFGGGRKVTDVAKVHARITGAEPKVRTLKPETPEELAAIVDKAIALTVEERYADAAAFADALEAYIESTGKKPSAKSLSALLSPWFVTERAAMQKLIDQQVQLSQSGLIELGDATGDLPRLGGSTEMRSASGLYLAEGGENSTGGRRDLMEATRGVATRAAESSSSKKPMILALAVAAVLGGALALLMPGDEKVSEPLSQPMDPGTPAAATTAPSPEPQREAEQQDQQPSDLLAARPPSVILDLKVSPPEARVSLDGAPISVPFSGEFRKDTALHHLEVSAEGYRTHKRLIQFDKDQALQIELEELPVRTAAPRRPSARPQAASARRAEPSGDNDVQESKPSASEAAPTPAAAPTPGQDLVPKPRIKRGEIDVSDPYSTK